MPQEVEVFYVIPAIRRELALAMKSSGKKQREIAKLLCVEDSTVSQYVNDKRATRINLNNKVKGAVASSVKKIKDMVSLVREIQNLLKLVKNENALCEIHRAKSSLPKSCNACLFR